MLRGDVEWLGVTDERLHFIGKDASLPRRARVPDKTSRDMNSLGISDWSRHATPTSVLALQRLAGNRAVNEAIKHGRVSAPQTVQRSPCGGGCGGSCCGDPAAEQNQDAELHMAKVPSSESSFAFDSSRIPLHAPQTAITGPAVSTKGGADDPGGGAAATATPTTAGAAAPAAKTVDIHSVSLPGSTRDPFADVARASAIWSQCSLKVNMSGGSWKTDLLDKMPPTKTLNEYPDPSSPTQEEIDLLKHHPGGVGTIHAYYVPAMSAGSRGESFWASVTPNGVRAVVVSDSAASDTFAHELGHVLLNNGGHHGDPDNLMASGDSRRVGVDKLDATQCSKV